MNPFAWKPLKVDWILEERIKVKRLFPKAAGIFGGMLPCLIPRFRIGAKPGNHVGEGMKSDRWQAV
ncbi:MAG: hypothetical protein LBM00_11595, partial [Deltaproteobacteria bacterium]|nr:hypothetical protein [Deltaproteobacteria bacterium]